MQQLHLPGLRVNFQGQEVIYILSASWPTAEGLHSLMQPFLCRGVGPRMYLPLTRHHTGQAFFWKDVAYFEAFQKPQEHLESIF